MVCEGVTIVILGSECIENLFPSVYCIEHEIVESGNFDNPDEISLDDDEVAMDTSDITPGKYNYISYTHTFSYSHTLTDCIVS